MINVIRKIFVQNEIKEVSPRPIPPRDPFIPEFNEVFNTIKNEIDKSHCRKVGRGRS